MTELPEDFQTAPLGEVDPEIAEVLDRELARQQGTLEMIASENFVPQGVLDAAGSVLTNKYAEGYPGKRYYGGCEEVDVAEELAIERAKELFGAEHANVQPHAGAQANNAVYTALMEPGDTFLGLALDHGGHLTHGMKLNLSGKLYNPVAYHVDRESLLVDMDEVARLAEEHRPKLIVAGWSAYPRQLDFAAFREIADSVGAKLMVDMAHFAGLVAAGEHPNPVEHADVVTTTVHKTLCGPRSGLILCREELKADINRSIFPGSQGGPLMHIIAAKAVALRIAQSEEFRRAPAPDDRQRPRLRRGPGRRRRRRAHRRHRRPPGARRRDHEGAGGKDGGDAPRGDRDHRQPQRDPLRRAPAARSLRAADRHPGADHPRPRRGRDARDRRRDLRRAQRRLGVGARVAAGANPRARRRPPALPAALAATSSDPANACEIWVDCTAAAHPLVLRPLIEELGRRGHEVEITARRYGQTEGILDRLGLPYESFGSHAGASTLAKGRAVASRSAALARWARPRGFDLGIAHGSVDLAAVAATLRIPTAQMQDYEWAGLQRKLAWRIARRVIVPDAIPLDRLEAAGASADKLVRYPGLKEDYYLAGFEPDPAVLSEIGLDALGVLPARAEDGRVLMVVRPPPDTSAYHADNPLYEGVLDRLCADPSAVTS